MLSRRAQRNVERTWVCGAEGKGQDKVDLEIVGKDARREARRTDDLRRHVRAHFRMIPSLPEMLEDNLNNI
jgi:hypothetical protein